MFLHSRMPLLVPHCLSGWLAWQIEGTIMVKKSRKLCPYHKPSATITINLASSVSKKLLEASQMRNHAMHIEKQVLQIEITAFENSIVHQIYHQTVMQPRDKNWTKRKLQTCTGHNTHTLLHNCILEMSGWLVKGLGMLTDVQVSGVAANFRGFVKWTFKLSTWSANGKFFPCVPMFSLLGTAPCTSQESPQCESKLANISDFALS